MMYKLNKHYGRRKGYIPQRFYWEFKMWMPCYDNLNGSYGFLSYTLGTRKGVKSCKRKNYMWCGRFEYER